MLLMQGSLTGGLPASGVGAGPASTPASTPASSITTTPPSLGWDSASGVPKSAVVPASADVIETVPVSCGVGSFMSCAGSHASRLADSKAAIRIFTLSTRATPMPIAPPAPVCRPIAPRGSRLPYPRSDHGHQPRSSSKCKRGFVVASCRIHPTERVSRRPPTFDPKNPRSRLADTRSATRLTNACRRPALVEPSLLRRPLFRHSVSSGDEVIRLTVSFSVEAC